MKSKLAVLFAIGLILISHVAHAQSRDQISVVGSSTVYPFTTTVAEKFGRGGKFKTPKVESTGTGGGIKLFCNGIGPQHPDVVNASRAMKKSEVETCAKNNVNAILEVKVGFDGIVIAEQKAGALSALTKKQVYLALAKTIPNASGQMIPNPNKTWKDVDAKLPATKIEVLGPPPTSGTRDSFLELFMEEGCTLENKKQCHAIREDGAYIEAGENDNLIAQKLAANKNALGIFGYSFLEENADKLKGLKVDGVEPSFETISSGEYTAARPLFIYVKKQHIGTIPGIKEFVEEYVSEKAIGEEGYLSDRGLVALEKSDLAKVRNDVRTMKNYQPK
ncbi:PstS family phosphate ABC transporter substrate-binding protein [bacterium]|nr:PstS family phosphate ABC transporter substrate-binding protein [bacterium]